MFNIIDNNKIIPVPFYLTFPHIDLSLRESNKIFKLNFTLATNWKKIEKRNEKIDTTNMKLIRNS